MDKSVPPVTVWHHSAEPRDAKTMTFGTDLSIRTSHSCQILIILNDSRREKICEFFSFLYFYFEQVRPNRHNSFHAW